MPRPVSQAQARFYGAIAGGSAHVKGFTRAAARNELRGMKVKRLPKRSRTNTARGAARRTSGRRGRGALPGSRGHGRR